ncbi:MAG TPA: diiron oxygenase [Thermoanaerobaculia bacterium]|jgi:hypothetical protein
MQQAILNLNETKMRQLSGLVDKSNASHMELNDVLPWANGIDRTVAPKREDHAWLYGTPYWEQLTPEHKIEMMWVENAQTVSGFVWLEEGLSPLFIRLLHAHHGRVPETIRDYMMVFCKEEIVHTQMFRRYLKLANLPLYERPQLMDFIEELVTMHPAVGVLCTYLMEGTAEEAAMRQDGPGTEPLTRKLYFEHHREEARHLAFGRWICEEFFENLPPQVRGQIGFLVRSYMNIVVPLFTFNPEIQKYLSFELPFDVNDPAVIDAIRRSDNNRRVNDERYGPMLRWIKKLGLTPAEWDWFDGPGQMPQMPAAKAAEQPAA